MAVASLQQRVGAVEGRVSQGPGGEGVEDRFVALGSLGLPEPITEGTEPSEEQVGGATAGLVVEIRQPRAASEAVRYKLAWSRLTNGRPCSIPATR